METKIIRKNKNKYLVQFDEEELLIYEDILLKYELLIHKSISNEDFISLKYDNQLQEIKEYVYKLLSRKLYSKYEIKQKLKEYDSFMVKECLLELEEQGYINDKEYTDSYIHDKILLSNDGPRKILNDLKFMNIDINYIYDSLEQYNKGIEEDKINKLIDKRIKLNKKSLKRFKLDTSEYLYQKGFNSNIIKKVLDKVYFDDSEYKIDELNKLKKKYPNKEEYFYKQKLYEKGFSNY